MKTESLLGLNPVPIFNEESYRRFGGACCLHFQGPRRTYFDSEDGDSRRFRNASNYLPNDIALYIRGLEFSQNTHRNVGFPVEIRTGHILHMSQSVTACVNIR
jgi:hypothetical protein